MSAFIAWTGPPICSLCTKAGIRLKSGAICSFCGTYIELPEGHPNTPSYVEPTKASWCGIAFPETSPATELGIVIDEVDIDATGGLAIYCTTEDRYVWIACVDTKSDTIVFHGPGVTKGYPFALDRLERVNDFLMRAPRKALARERNALLVIPDRTEVA